MIESESDAARLAADLNDPGRERPIVVVSTPTGRRLPWIDADRLRDEVGEHAQVHVIVTGSASWAFSEAMAPGTQVYGGAGRVYPVGTEWIRNLSLSPLRFAYSAADGPRATDRLIDDAFAAALAGGAASASRARRTREATGVVIGCPTDSQAIVKLDDGSMATIQVGLIVNGVAADQVFVKGMDVSGRLDVDARQLLIERLAPTVEDVESSVPPGDLIPVRVVDADADTCTLAVLPGVEVRLERAAATANPLDRLDDLLSVDEVVALRRGSGGPTWTLLDVDDDEACRPALSVLPGGPPWLPDPHTDRDRMREAPASTPSRHSQGADAASAEQTPAPGSVDEIVARILGEDAIDQLTREAIAEHDARVASSEPAPRPSPAMLGPRARSLAPDSGEASLTSQAPAPNGRALQDTQAALAQARARNAVLERAVQDQQWEVRALRQEISDLRRDGARLADDVRRLRQANRRKASRTMPVEQPVESDDLFLDPVDAFRWEVEQAWVRRIPASEKAARPLGSYAVGPGFLASLEATQGVSRAKVVDVVVEVLCGLVDELAGRDLHQLRTGPGGGDAPVRREDGSTCWRAAIQQGTPSARRLHFWRTKDGIELSRVVLHDDMEP